MKKNIYILSLIMLSYILCSSSLYAMDNNIANQSNIFSTDCNIYKASKYRSAPPASPNLLVFTIWKTIPGSGFSNLDGTVVVFDSSYFKAVGSEDSRKFSNGGENISILEGTIDVGIDGLPLPQPGDSIFIHLYQLINDTTYHFKVDATSFSNASLPVNAYVFDRYLNKNYALNADSNVISFQAKTANPATYSNRFGIYFVQKPLSVNFTNVTANKKGEIVTINWNTANEKDLNYYEVEYSNNGKDFTTVKQVTAKNKAEAEYTITVNWQLNSNAIYYRIKAVESNGKVYYSKVVTLKNTASEIIISPNPARSNVTVEGNNMHNIRITDMSGKTIIQKELSGTNRITISLEGINKGIYLVNTVLNNGENTVQKLVVE